MILYLAGDIKGNDEKRLFKKARRWMRLFSYCYTIQRKGQFNTMLNIKKENNNNDRKARASSSISPAELR